MCNRKKTEFESRLIWNDKGTACFIPEEFSSVKLSNPYIMVQTKAGNRVAICEYSDKDKTKARLQELMKEIGEKLSAKSFITNTFAGFLDTANSKQLRELAIKLAPYNEDR